MKHHIRTFRPDRPIRQARSGIALIPMLGLLVLLALLTSMLAQRHVRGHREFQTQARKALAREIAAGEVQRIVRSIESGVPVAASKRTVTAAEIPGLPEPVAIETYRSEGAGPMYRVEVRIPADAGPFVVRESLEIP